MNARAEQVYVCEPEADQSKAIIGLLRRWRPNLKIIGVSFRQASVATTGASSGVDGLVRWEEMQEEGFIEKTVIPAGALSTRAMLQRADVICGDAVLTRNALDVYDKLNLLELAQERGIPVPLTWSSPDAVDQYPAFYKQAFEKGGGIRGVATSRAELPKNSEGELIYQELIASPGTYGVAFVARNGVVLTKFIHFERHSYPASGGSAVYLEQFNDQRLIELTERLVDITDYSGWGLAEFKYCPRRSDYVLMEINAKFWASCEFAFANEPAFAKLLFGIDVPKQDIPNMLFLHRFVARGPAFMVANSALLTSSRIVNYGNMFRLFVLSLMPPGLLMRLRRSSRSSVRKRAISE